jgi:hypothetical protein
MPVSLGVRRRERMIIEPKLTISEQYVPIKENASDRLISGKRLLLEFYVSGQ